MLRFLQNSPHALEVVYASTARALKPFRRWLKPGGRMERFFVRFEELTKGAAFDCRTCGQCVLHSTGMTCPMTCPKTLRNGPCGGVREDGHCEVKPEMRCVWVTAVDRAEHLPLLPAAWRHEIDDLRPPVDHRLRGTSSWLNLASGRDRRTPDGWRAR